jgi:hypothetical protein
LGHAQQPHSLQLNALDPGNSYEQHLIDDEIDAMGISSAAHADALRA